MDNRERIIEGAAGLFRIYGIKSVTMDSIANHLGMSKRTIYELFADKDELLIGVLNSMTKKQKELVKKVLDESDNAILAIFRLLEINRDHFQNMSPAFQADLKKFYQEVLIKNADKCEMPDYKSNQQVIESGIRQKLFRKDIDPDLVNRFLYLIFSSMLNQDLFPFEQFSTREVIRNGVLNFLRGISTNDGVELINKLEKKF
jgi:AcrR family transcriptional regulator